MAKWTSLTAQEISDRLTTRERECREAVRKDVKAHEALRFLALRARRKDERWTEELMAFLFVETVRVLADQTAKNEPGPQDSKPEAVVEFASYLFKASLAIRNMNSQNFWQAERPARWSSLMPVHAREARAAQRDFEELPRVLALYAQSLRLKAERALRRRKTLRRIKGSHFRAELELIKTISDLTGHMYCDKIAAILLVLNPMHKLHWTDADALRKRAQRYLGLVRARPLTAEEAGHFPFLR